MAILIASALCSIHECLTCVLWKGYMHCMMSVMITARSLKVAYGRGPIVHVDVRH